jgi:GTP pyrophosphokinase
VGPQGKPVEIQIRTAEMHRIAEHGIAAHWRYKEKETDKKFDAKLSWLRQMVDWQSDLADARDFMETLKVDLFTDEVFVFSPKGTVLSLPVGATPIDFAYHIHTEVGHRCQGAKINGRIVPLNTKLKNGDIVEILTGKTNNPKLDWINFSKTSGARNKIKQWLKKEKRGENIERGYKLLSEKIIELGLNPKEILKPDAISPIFKSYNASTLDDLFSFIGYGEVSAYKVSHSILELFPKKETPPEKEALESYILKRKPKGGQGVLVSGESGVMVRFSKCCNPLPGDPIVGFITKGAGISIHRRDCHNVLLLATRPTRKIKVEWDSSFESTYPVEIEVEAFDRVGLAKDILSQVSETGTNITSVDMKSKKGSHAVIKIAVDIKNIDHLQQVMQSVRKISDVYDVYRVRS